MKLLGPTVKRVLQSARRVSKTGADPQSPDQFLGQCRSIIHVGANEGHERALYDSYSLSVLWVEALPDVYTKLVENLSGYPKQQAVNALVTDIEGESYDFHVSNNSGESSSVFDFQDHKKLWPDVGFDRTIRLRSTTLEALLRSRGLSPSDFDALVLDVQGAELLVVLGSGELLKYVRYVKAEAADFESYKGACTFATLTQCLEERGFAYRLKDRFAGKSGVGSYYNILYERSTGSKEAKK
jgi:FkbM family methyltransferase